MLHLRKSEMCTYDSADAPVGDRSPLILRSCNRWSHANAIADTDDSGRRFARICRSTRSQEPKYFYMNVANPISPSFLFPFHLNRRILIETFFCRSPRVYLQIQIVQPVAIKLNDTTNIPFIQVIVASATAHVHSYGYVISDVSGVIITVCKIIRLQV